MVWQKSIETDFLLTMNFILFTNQGYPLQNSSLGQLHSDGGVVSIVRSSAGRLLLVYLSARRLRFVTVCPGGTNSLWTAKKTTEHRFHFGFAHSRFLGTGRVCSVPLPTLAFCLGVVLQNP